MTDRFTINQYIALVLVEMGLIGGSAELLGRGRFSASARLLVFASLIGPWGCVLIDASIAQGNIIPLVFLTIPILISSFFTEARITLLVGAIQILGFAFFFMSSGVKSYTNGIALFYFLVSIYAISFIYSYQNQSNRSLINRQMNTLSELATHDQLTRLYNRHFLNEFFQKEFARLERNGGKLSVIILDVDDLKRINDVYGHECGDDILVGISNLLMRSFRQTDVICRFGGDEFLIAMTGSAKTEARAKCMDLVARISASNLGQTLGIVEPVHVSAGIATYPENGQTPSALIKTADNALYVAKNNGKNRIEIAP